MTRYYQHKGEYLHEINKQFPGRHCIDRRCLSVLVLRWGAMTSGMMNDGAHGTGTMGERSWM
jgi:hypothetical protein